MTTTERAARIQRAAARGRRRRETEIAVRRQLRAEAQRRFDESDVWRRGIRPIAKVAS